MPDPIGVAMFMSILRIEPPHNIFLQHLEVPSEIYFWRELWTSTILEPVWESTAEFTLLLEPT